MSGTPFGRSQLGDAGVATRGGVLPVRMNHHRGAVGMLDDAAGDAAEQHGAQAGEPARAHDYRGRALAIGELDDRLPEGAGGLYGDGFGLKAGVARDAGTLLGSPAGGFRRGAIELDVVDQNRR